MACMNIRHEVEIYRVSEDDIKSMLTKLVLGIKYHPINQKKVKVPKQLIMDSTVQVKHIIKIQDKVLALYHIDNQIVLGQRDLKVDYGTSTGKWSSSSAPVQNLPKGIVI